jgi:hypothetical protein
VRGRVRLHASCVTACSAACRDQGEDIDVLTGDAPALFGGAAVHDNRVWVRRR